MKRSIFLTLYILLMTFDVSLQFHEKIHKLINALVYKNMEILSRPYLDYLVKFLKTSTTDENQGNIKMMFYEAAAWADKDKPICKQMANMHFTDLKIEKIPGAPISGLPERIGSVQDANRVIGTYIFNATFPRNISKGILLMINIIFSKPEVIKQYPKITKPMALKFLMHFIQDIHQPTHVVSLVDKVQKGPPIMKKRKTIRKKILKNGDEHGKLFKIREDTDLTKEISLLTFWDLSLKDYESKISKAQINNIVLIEREANHIYQDYIQNNKMNDLSFLFERQNKTIGDRVKFSDAFYSTTNYMQFMTMLDTEIRTWVEESKRIAMMYVYNGAVYGAALTPEYISRGKAVMLEQVVVAAQRTQQVIIKLLNMIRHVIPESIEAAQIKGVHDQIEAEKILAIQAEQLKAKNLLKKQEQDQRTVRKKEINSLMATNILSSLKTHQELEEETAALERIKKRKADQELELKRKNEEEARKKLLEDQRIAAENKRLDDLEKQVLERIKNREAEKAQIIKQQREEAALQKKIQEGIDAQAALQKAKDQERANKFNASLKQPERNTPLSSFKRKLIDSTAQAPLTKKVRENLLQI